MGKPLCVLAVLVAVGSDCRELGSPSARAPWPVPAHARITVQRKRSPHDGQAVSGICPGSETEADASAWSCAPEDSRADGAALERGRSHLPGSVVERGETDEDLLDAARLLLEGRFARAREYYTAGDYARATQGFRELISDLEGEECPGAESAACIREAETWLRLAQEANELTQPSGREPSIRGPCVSLDCHDAPLAEVAATLTRISGIAIALEPSSEAELASLRVSLSAADCPLTAVLHMLERMHGLKATLRGGTVVLHSAK
ncbi:MAG: DUF4974 domain-containing protein [Planctomycetes bacterium]|nr:DUF4974 domain-containing protein [Planctomycetota bacterium]